MIRSTQYEVIYYGVRSIPYYSSTHIKYSEVFFIFVLHFFFVTILVCSNTTAVEY